MADEGRGFLGAIGRLFGRGEPKVVAAPSLPASTPVSEQQQAAIAGNVALVQGDFARDTGTVFDLGRASLEYLDGFIRRQHERGGDHGNLPQIFGSYLGECIRHRDGGRWVNDPDGFVGLEIEQNFTVYPISKAEKQFEAGDGDSILGFYDTIPSLLAAHRDGTLGRPRG